MTFLNTMTLTLSMLTSVNRAFHPCRNGKAIMTLANWQCRRLWDMLDQEIGFCFNVCSCCVWRQAKTRWGSLDLHGACTPHAGCLAKMSGLGLLCCHLLSWRIAEGSPFNLTMSVTLKLDVGTSSTSMPRNFLYNSESKTHWKLDGLNATSRWDCQWRKLDEVSSSLRGSLKHAERELDSACHWQWCPCHWEPTGSSEWSYIWY